MAGLWPEIFRLGVEVGPRAIAVVSNQVCRILFLVTVAANTTIFMLIVNVHDNITLAASEVVTDATSTQFATLWTCLQGGAVEPVVTIVTLEALRIAT